MVIGAGLISLAKADIKYNVFTNEWKEQLQILN